MPTAMPAAAATPAPALPFTPQPPAVSSDDDKKTSGGAVKKVLNDNELIEKHWVEKAKAIVARTKDDPYRQAIEMSSEKAEYLQQNYNKTLKLNK